MGGRGAFHSRPGAHARALYTMCVHGGARVLWAGAAVYLEQRWVACKIALPPVAAPATGGGVRVLRAPCCLWFLSINAV